MKSKITSASLAVLLSASFAFAATDAPDTSANAIFAQPPGAPAPYGATPTLRQYNWQMLGMYAFLHFGPNTFTNKDWGFGDEKESVFNPTDFDADQMVRAVKSAGMAGLIVTGKHHDGFCLWPSKYTEHSVKNSPWKNGQGDVLKELSEACRKYGIKFGVYVSPWDRNRADYGTPEYVTYYHNQIREVATNYGPLFEMWFDGANGGDGYYGGKGGSRSVNYNTYYGWKDIRAMLRELQPGCAIWGGFYTENNRTVFADCHWGGSEGGDIGVPNWETMNSQTTSDPGIGGWHIGVKGGDTWCPAEGDVSIRPSWFYHASEDNQVRSPQNLMSIYLNSVGRGGNLILNVPPDQRGRIHETDEKSLEGFGQLLKATFATNLAAGATATASNIRGGNAASFGPGLMLDGNPRTYWATDDGVTQAAAVLEFRQSVAFNLVRLREDIRLGQRVEEFALDAWQDNGSGGGQWKPFANGQTIGACCLVPCNQRTTRVRLRITKSLACPAIAELGLFDAPKEADVESKAVQPPQILFTGISKKKWKIVSESSGATGNHTASQAIDENAGTFWDTYGHAVPQEFVVDMGEEVNVGGFTCLPRQDHCSDGVVDKYVFYLSEDGKTWGAPAAEGEFANVKANPIEQTVAITPTKARYFKFVAKHSVQGAHANVAELGIVRAPQAPPK